MKWEKNADPTVQNSFWSQRRLTGSSLILGCCLFLGVAGLIPTDSQGDFIINLPVKQQLLGILLLLPAARSPALRIEHVTEPV